MKSNRPSKWKVLLVGLFFSEAIVGLVGPVSSPVEATESSGDIYKSLIHKTPGNHLTRRRSESTANWTGSF